MVRGYVRQGARIADLCAGEGAFSLQLALEGYTVVAADIDGEHFAVPNVLFYSMDLRQPFAEKLGAGLFDSVVAIECIEHLENPWEFLRECRLLVKPGGILLLSTPNVECVLSRMVFLLSGCFVTFDRTMTNPNHITPMFSWILSHALAGARFRLIETVFTSAGWAARHNWKLWLASKAQWLLYPFIRNAAFGETRLIIAEAMDA
jgi:SAM-dependent methyltransferase